MPYGKKLFLLFDELGMPSDAKEGHKRYFSTVITFLPKVTAIEE